MSQAYKRCPICEALNHQDASACSNCGTSLTAVEAQARSHESQQAQKIYDYRHGEADLFEGALWSSARRLSVGFAVMGIALLVIMSLAVFSALSGREAASPGALSPTAVPQRAQFATVTPGMPTSAPTSTPMPTQIPTDTATPSPCIHQVAAGDSLIGIIARCGYSDLDILPTVRAINGIVDETRIQIGQSIVIPLPSATVDPLATPAPQLNAAASLEDNPAAAGLDELEGLALLSFDPFAPTATPTLAPGLMWHRVAAGESMIEIAIRYDSTAKQLADINPQVEFALCDFGQPYGGGECIVELFEGQTLRVIAPTATTTPAPTLSGSETPLPPATATVNAPFAVGPPDQAFFTASDQITLRWVTTGSLAADESFRVLFAEVGTDKQFTGETRDLFFIVPRHWQAEDDQRHSYSWQVAIVKDSSNTATETTDARTLVWVGAQGGAS